MITAYALFALVLSALIGGLALLVERGTRIVGTTTRFVWLAAMVLMIAAPAVAIVRNSVTINTQYSATSGVVVSSERLASGRPRSTLADVTPGARDLVDVPLRAWRTTLSTVSQHTQRFDRVLMVLWVSLSIALLVFGVRALREGQRLPRQLEARTIDGTLVYVSESVGPSAIGGQASAIVIPRWVLDLDQSLLALIIRHEREHLTSRDPSLLIAGMLLLIVVPWHLGLWWCWRRLRLALEIDCDARVLRTEANARRYAQLLLLMTHHRSRVPLRVGPSLNLTAPLHPHASQLKRRIAEMTSPRPARPLATLITLGVGALCVSALVAAVPAPVSATPTLPAPTAHEDAATRRSDSVTVTIDKVGLTNISVDANGALVGDILIYGTGPVKVGLGLGSLTLVSDTIRLKTFPAFTADVTNGDVHVELRGGTGYLEIGGAVRGGPASKVGASGRHLVLLKGGSGINIVQR